MGIGAAIAGGTALIGAGASIYGSSKAASAQKSAAKQNAALEQSQIAENEREYNQNRDDLAPYRTAGYTALGQIASGTQAGGEFNTPYTLANFQQDPGYQFRLDQGQRGVEASAAARGGVLSGGALKSLDTYNSGQASQEYGAAYDRYQSDLTGRYNRLAGISGTGQQAVNQGIAASNALTTQNQTATNGIVSANDGAANATASSYTAAGNAIGNAAKTVGSYYALNTIGSGGYYSSEADAPQYGFGAWNVA